MYLKERHFKTLWLFVLMMDIIVFLFVLLFTKTILFCLEPTENINGLLVGYMSGDKVSIRVF